MGEGIYTHVCCRHTCTPGTGRERERKGKGPLQSVSFADCNRTHDEKDVETGQRKGSYWWLSLSVYPEQSYSTIASSHCIELDRAGLKSKGAEKEEK